MRVLQNGVSERRDLHNPLAQIGIGMVDAGANISDAHEMYPMTFAHALSSCLRDLRVTLPNVSTTTITPTSYEAMINIYVLRLAALTGFTDEYRVPPSFFETVATTLQSTTNTDDPLLQLLKETIITYSACHFYYQKMLLHYSGERFINRRN